MPDISLLEDLSEILGITINELLSGKKLNKPSEKTETIILDSLKDN